MTRCSDIEIVIPWAGGCPHREAALAWLRRRLHWPVTVAEAPAGPWRKALATMPRIAASAAEVIVVHDADVWAPGLDRAIDAVRGGAAWAAPHRGVFRLTAAATRQVLAGTEPHEGLELEERAYLGMLGGGVVVARRELLEEVPLDPGYAGWGQEDHAWGIALETIAGPATRIRAPLWHLWHPPQPRMSRRRGSRAGWALFTRYQAARDDAPAMRLLLEEAHRAL